jgi:FkbM family methyltransferase
MPINETRNKFQNGKLSKPEFIKAMYQNHHSSLFDYSEFLKETNISSIEILDDEVIMTSRDKGVKIICPKGDFRVAPVEALNFLDYEPVDSNMMMRLISSDANIIDIGANMGWYAINFAKTFPLSKIFAFEPIPQTYSFLKKNIALNKVSNITACQFGLSNEKKSLTFYLYPEGSGNASAENLSERNDAEMVQCQVEVLDDFVNSHQLKIDFIKCDVEGAELFAFLGAKKTIARDKPIIFTEMLRKWAAKFNYHPNEIIKFLNSLGYKCFYANNQFLKEFFVMTDETAETNFFFLHSEKHKLLINQLLK